MTIDYRMVEFMIIPRFLISKKKIKEFAENEELQDNIGILISYECFGHYNNESNKKFPSKKQMDLFNGLIVQKKGKERYKKITSINHGGKFIKQYPT